MKSWSVRYFIQIPGNWTFCGHMKLNIMWTVVDNLALSFIPPFSTLQHQNNKLTITERWREKECEHIYFFFLNDKLWRQLWGGFFLLAVPSSSCPCLLERVFFSFILSDYCYYPTENLLNKYEIEKLASYYHYPSQIWKFWPTTLSSCILMGFAYNSVTSKYQEKRKLFKFTYIYVYYLFVLIQLSLLR